MYSVKRVFPNIDYCEDCFLNYVKDHIVMNKDLEPVIYSDQRVLHLSMTKPEKGKCLYKRYDSLYRGWYCSKNSYKEYNMCTDCINYIFDEGDRCPHIDSEKLKYMVSDI